MTCLDYIKILAKDDNGFEGLIPLVIIGAIWVAGAIAAKMKKKEAEAKANQIRQNKAIQNDNNKDNDGWQIIAPPPQKPPPPVQQPRPVPARKPSIQQFVKNKVEESHSNLIQPKAVEHLQHVDVEPLPVLHADGDQTQPPTRRDKTRSRKKLASAKETQAPAETPTRTRALSGLARLGDPKAARSAMIFHEILSTPKALRDEDNMWD
jgi:hypothetical protein